MQKRKYLGIMLLKSFSFAVIVSAIMYSLRLFLNTETFLVDIGGISAFASIYGTLFGIAVALVLLEVWTQFNKTSELTDKEAGGLERLYGISTYFRDKPLETKMRNAIEKYFLIVTKNFQSLSVGKRDSESGKAFREISQVINKIRFDDDHDAVVFGKIIEHYTHLSEIRTARINQSLARLPATLKVFLYTASFCTLLVVAAMPYQNVYYGFLMTGAISFVLWMVFQLINDLDNPFAGFWVITTEPFDRAMKHIREDY